MRYCFLTLFAISFLFFNACNSGQNKEVKSEKEVVEKPKEKMGFQLVHDSISGVSFMNELREDEHLNYFTYSYMYMGGGVSIGDINNDNLPDIYFTGNRVKNRLYLNKGNMEFEDITAKAGVIGDDRWYTGVAMADVNNDGLLDIYLNVSGKFTTKENQLFINNGDLTFTESAAKYGLNDDASSVQSNFFDYDKDGDLDLYLANYPPTSFKASNQYYHDKLKNPTDDETDKFFRNDGEKGFVNVTDEAGIRNFGLSLSTSIADYNNDGFQDVYVSNDFTSPDFLYINQGDGTFKDEIKTYTKHTALYGMGTDAADINNDGLIDLIQLDMLSEGNKEQKTNMPPMNPARFYGAVELGLHHQYMRNCLQLNNGNGSFSDIAELANVDATDWSWSALLVDMDNDGWKDIFISNGMRRSVNDKDYTRGLMKKNKSSEIKKEDILSVLQSMPVQTVKNYSYKNNGDLTFEKKVDEWGIDYRGFTNGVAYGDLDGDGDLDMVINNLDIKSMIYQNNATATGAGNYLRLRLKGKEDNQFGLGAKITVKSGKLEQYQELMTARGFQSSVEPIAHFGLGENDMVDEVEISWPNGKVQRLNNINSNQLITIEQNGESLTEEKSNQKKLFIENTKLLALDYTHEENIYDDFQKEELLPHKMSQFGPGMAVGDINKDGLEDVFVGAAAGKVPQLYIQKEDGSFKRWASTALNNDKASEDLDALFLDVENDGDLDLYVVSGGNEFKRNAKELQDRLYLNDGKGNFTKAKDALPIMLSSGGCVAANDFDKDGDLDLFVGGRVIPAMYPYPAKSYLLKNNDGVFEDVTAAKAPELTKAGLVTSAVWTDFNKDGNSDLVITGEWMPIRFFENSGNTFIEKTSDFGFDNSTGWWFDLKTADMDGDGDEDFVAGNLGLNYKYKGSVKEPFHVYAGDLDQNGSKDIILGYYNDGKKYPVRGLQCSSSQMPSLKQKFKSYNDFGDATLENVYGEKNLDTALHYEATMFESVYIENKGNGDFEINPLPNMAQISSVNSIVLYDFDQDGKKDILIAGNLFTSEVETPRNDAGIGLLLKGNGNGSFEPVPSRKSGFFAPYVVNSMEVLTTNNQSYILIGNNDAPFQSFQLNPENEPIQ